MGYCTKIVCGYCNFPNDVNPYVNVFALFDLDKISCEEIELPNGVITNKDFYFDGDGNNPVKKDCYNDPIKEYTYSDIKYWIDNVKRESFNDIAWMNIEMMKVMISKIENDKDKNNYIFFKYGY